MDFSTEAEAVLEAARRWQLAREAAAQDPSKSAELDAARADLIEAVKAWRVTVEL